MSVMMARGVAVFALDDCSRIRQAMNCCLRVGLARSLYHFGSRQVFDRSTTLPPAEVERLDASAGFWEILKWFWAEKQWAEKVLRPSVRQESCSRLVQVESSQPVGLSAMRPSASIASGDWRGAASASAGPLSSPCRCVGRGLVCGEVKEQRRVVVDARGRTDVCQQRG